MVDLKDAKAVETQQADLDKLLDKARKYERFEIIEGKVIPLAPTKPIHGLVAGKVFLMLALYAQQHKLGRVFAAETGFFTRGDKKTVRAPDVAFVSYQKIPAGELPGDFLSVAPELAVEVVSPGDRAGEIETKTREWLDFGAALVWIVYPEAKRVHVCTIGNQIHVLSTTDKIDGGSILPGFEAAISAFFED